MSVEYHTSAFGFAGVIISAEVRRNSRSDALGVVADSPIVIQSIPVRTPLSSLVVAHILVDRPIVDGRHRTTEAAALGVDKVHRHLHRQVFYRLKFALQEDAQAVFVVLWHHTFVVHIAC